MRGHVHITKAKDWLEASKQRIGLREWIRVVEDEGDLQLEAPEAAEAEQEGIPVIPEEPGIAVWRKTENQKVVFEYHHGQVNVEAADEDALAKAKKIAQKLEARVLTDTGEEC